MRRILLIVTMALAVGQGMAQQPSGVAGRGRGGPRQHLVVQPGRAGQHLVGQQAPAPGGRPGGLERTTADRFGDPPELAGSILEWALATGNKNSRSHFYATQRKAQTAFYESNAQIR